MATSKRSLSVLTKLVLSVALLVSLLVAALGTIDLMSMLRIYDDAARQREASGEAAIRREGSAIAGKLAVTLAPAVAEINYSLIQEIVDAAAKDELILYSLAADELGNVIASSGLTKAPKKVKRRAGGQVAAAPAEEAVDEQAALLFAAPLLYGGKNRGEVWLSYSLANLQRELVRIQEERVATTQKTVTKTVLTGVGCLFCALLLAVGQGLQITRPVRELATKARQIARGDLTARAQVQSRDEFGQLGSTFNHMADRIQALLNETAEKVALEKEMEVAATVQDRLVAPSDLIERGRLQLAGYYAPASFCGGDFWNYFPLTEERTLLVVGDVTGHGLPSAMLTASAKSCFDTLRSTRGDDMSVLQLMQALNTVIYEAARGHLQMTCFVTIIDTATSEMHFASAGHPMPYVCRPQNGKYVLKSMMAQGNRLGDLPTWEFSEAKMALQAGDLMLWFTDGITEGENPDGRQWGERSLGRQLRKHAANPPDKVRDEVIKAAYNFYAGETPEDDITLVIGRLS